MMKRSLRDVGSTEKALMIKADAPLRAIMLAVLVVVFFPEANAAAVNSTTSAIRCGNAEQAYP